MPESPSGRRLVSLAKAAEYLDTSPRTVRRAISSGRLTGYRFGPRTLRVDLNEVDAVIRRVPALGKTMQSAEAPSVSSRARTAAPRRRP